MGVLGVGLRLVTEVQTVVRGSGSWWEPMRGMARMRGGSGRIENRDWRWQFCGEWPEWRKE